jgi:hypothetical protein
MEIKSRRDIQGIFDTIFVQIEQLVKDQIYSVRQLGKEMKVLSSLCVTNRKAAVLGRWTRLESLSHEVSPIEIEGNESYRETT